MVQHRRKRIGFWVFLLLVALGAGWAANQEGGWPFLGLFAPTGEQGGEHQAAAVVQPVAETEDAPPGPDAVAESADPEPGAERSADAAARAQAPAEAEQLAAPSEGAPSPLSSAVSEAASMAPDQAGSDTETTLPAAQEAAPLASPSETAAAETSPGEQLAEVERARAGATGAASGTDQTATDPTARSGADMAASSPPQDGQGSAQTRDDAPADAAGTQATANVGSSLDALPESARQQSRGSGAVVAAIAPGAGQEPGQAGDASAGAAGEVAALLSDAKATDPPSFDIVRVEPDGRAVIAGRAAPGAEVELRSGDQVIDRVRASRRGDWVVIPDKPLSPGDQQLTLVAAHEGAPAVESQQMVVVAVPERESAVASQVSIAARQPVAVLLPRSGRGTGRILQAPGRISAAGTLALMTVGYDQQGQMLLSGEAPPGVPVRIYIDNQPMALVVGDAKGTWSSGLDRPLEPGTYTLRLDQLDEQGQTVARIETPITRVSEPPIEGELQVDYVVVQPGNSLWRIARRLTGRGVDYVYIYDRNQAQIRDPDLIFPGQVFQIPPEVGTADAG